MASTNQSADSDLRDTENSQVTLWPSGTPLGLGAKRFMSSLISLHGLPTRYRAIYLPRRIVGKNFAVSSTAAAIAASMTATAKTAPNSGTTNVFVATNLPSSLLAVTEYVPFTVVTVLLSRIHSKVPSSFGTVVSACYEHAVRICNIYIYCVRIRDLVSHASCHSYCVCHVFVPLHFYPDMYSIGLGD